SWHCRERDKKSMRYARGLDGSNSMLSRLPITCLLIALLFGCQVRAEDWPMFGRNQTRNAVSPEKNSPTWWEVPEWDRKGKMVSPGKNIHWFAELNRGGGWGSTYGDPIVLDGLVWIGTSRLDEKDARDAAALVCLDEKSGKLLYR